MENKDVKIIEVDNKTFYNILIKRDSLSSSCFENLLIMVEKIDNVDDLSAYIVKYNKSNDVSLFNPTKIDNEIETLFGRFYQYCYTACTPICTTAWGDGSGTEGHAMLNGCTFNHLECTEICGTYSGGPGGGESSGGGGANGGGATPPNDSPPINGANGAAPPELLIDPVFEEEVAEIQDRNPCEKLKAMSSAVIANVTPPKTAMTNFMDLKNNVTVNRERLYVMSPTPNANGSVNHNVYLEYFDQSAINQDNVSADFGGVMIDIMVHTHWSPTNHLSVFSLEDIYQIYRKIVSGQINHENKDYFTAMLITAHGTQYAMKFQSVTNFVTWAESYFRGWDYPNQALRDRYQAAKEDVFFKTTKIKPGNTPAIKTANELALTSFLQTNNVGMELYRVDDTFTQITKLSTTLTGALQETPCAN